MKYCVHCGKPLIDGAAFCVNCGRAVEGADCAPEGKAKFCTHCGAPLVNEAADYCVSCGCRVEGGYSDRAVSKNGALDTVAKVFMVLACVSAVAAAAMFALFAVCINIIPESDFQAIMAESLDPSLADEITVAMAVITYAACGGACLLSLAWCIPLTVYVFRCVKYGRPVAMSAKICILLLVSMVAGILLLCRTEPRRQAL